MVVKIDIEELQSQILDEYSSVIDSSTILAILSDYDLTNAKQLAAAKRVLEEIKAPISDDGVFDPSGANNVNQLFSSQGGEGASSGVYTSNQKTSDQDNSSMDENPQDVNEATALPTLNFSELDKSYGKMAEEEGYMSMYLSLDSIEAIERDLTSMFPTLKRFDIQRALKNCGGNATRAAEELMNLSFLEESGDRPKGVQGFLEIENAVVAETEPRKVPNPTKGKKRDSQPVNRLWSSLNLDGASAFGDVSTAGQPLASRMNSSKHTTPGNDNNVGSSPRPPLSKSAAHYSQARNTAFQQAATAYRKGKSDPLMGGAAAFYSELGRDFHLKAKLAESDEADTLVAAQSSKNKLDLHGVSVKDALRISKEGVNQWWHALGEERIGRRLVANEYRIITGVGNHSEDGRGKLGPAVGKMLIRENWKIRVEGGAVVVTGVARKTGPPARA